ncbi:hypothetical protein HYQ46_001717 [Verticillium longisporum]|nr:hypothetical protein HYQ46_001717 [Verticillium longisporum]
MRGIGSHTRKQRNGANFRLAVGWPEKTRVTEGTPSKAACRASICWRCADRPPRLATAFAYVPGIRDRVPSL